LILCLLIVVEVTCQVALSLPATAGSLDVEFALYSISGQGTDVVGNIDINNGIGTIEFNGKNYISVAYANQIWYEDLFDFIGIAEDSSDLAVFYTYSDDSTNNLTNIYYESLNTPLGVEDCAGSVSFSSVTSTEKAKLPPLKATAYPVKTNFTISGSEINYSNNQGWLIMENQNYSVTVFSTVDCYDCGDPGWYELHSILVPVASNKDAIVYKSACFGIIYLTIGDNTDAELDWGFCIPSLDTPSTSWLANWTGGL